MGLEGYTYIFHIPSLSKWLECLLYGVVGLCLIGLLAYFGKLLIYNPRLEHPWRRFFIALLIPSFGEELVFRGLLVPTQSVVKIAVMVNPWPQFGLAVAIFVFWHVFEGLTFLKSARKTFLNPWFLVCTALLGLTCAYMFYVSGSIWPCVICHALVVWVWQRYFNGLDLFNHILEKV
jgi:predicted Abi (CAAX) family protease